MAQVLYDSVPTPDGKWRVAILDKKGVCFQLLPSVCETKIEAGAYGRSYVKLFAH